MTAPTDEQLLAAHLAGDGHAFRKLVERYHREIYQFVFRFTRSASAADDVVQDTFVQVHLSANSFDADRRLKPWLFTIAANKARDHLRSRSRRKEMPLDAAVGDDEGQRFLDLMADDAAMPDEKLLDSERREIVREAVEQMPDNLAQILTLAYFNEFPYKEIADILDIPLGTVKSRLHSAVAHFGNTYRALLKNRERSQ